MKGNRSFIVLSIVFVLSAMLAACAVPASSPALNETVTPAVSTKDAAPAPATTAPTSEVVGDLRVLSPDTGSRKDRYLIEGAGAGSYDVGDDLLVYAELNPGNEVAIALLKVVGKNPTSLTAQAILIDPDNEIRVRMRVDGDLTFLSASQLVPVFAYADGYLLRPSRIRLRPDHLLTVGARLQALEFERINEEIVDALPTETIMQITSIGLDGQIAGVELLTGTWPLTGTIVSLVAMPSTATAPPVVVEEPTATMTTATPPTAIPSPTDAGSLCSFAFLVLDAQSESPIKGATVAVIVGIRQDTGATDSTGYYLAKLPCDSGQPVDARVRVFADDYGAYNRSVFLSDEMVEILLEHETTPTPIPTSTPIPIPLQTATAEPTRPSQPVVVATPTLAGASPCQVIGVFSSIWYTNRDKLGCNTSAVITSPITYEPFEKGYLIWSKLSDLIYTLPNEAYWSQHANNWNSSEDSLPCSQAKQFGYPAMGFGKLWCTDIQAQTNLGNPLGKEVPYESSQQQKFEGGFIFEIYGGNIIILFDDGLWRIN